MKRRGVGSSGAEHYLLFVSHGSFPQDGHLGEGVLLQTLQRVPARPQEFAHKVKLQGEAQEGERSMARRPSLR